MKYKLEITHKDSFAQNEYVQHLEDRNYSQRYSFIKHCIAARL